MPATTVFRPLAVPAPREIMDFPDEAPADNLVANLADQAKLRRNIHAHWPIGCLTRILGSDIRFLNQEPPTNLEQSLDFAGFARRYLNTHLPRLQECCRQSSD